MCTVANITQQYRPSSALDLQAWQNNRSPKFSKNLTQLARPTFSKPQLIQLGRESNACRYHSQNEGTSANRTKPEMVKPNAHDPVEYTNLVRSSYARASPPTAVQIQTS
jgi:hypothetical protein